MFRNQRRPSLRGVRGRHVPLHPANWLTFPASIHQKPQSVWGVSFLSLWGWRKTGGGPPTPPSLLNTWEPHSVNAVWGIILTSISTERKLCPPKDLMSYTKKNDLKLDAGGKPSTWFPPERLIELLPHWPKNFNSHQILMKKCLQIAPGHLKTLSKLI